MSGTRRIQSIPVRRFIYKMGIFLDSVQTRVTSIDLAVIEADSGPLPTRGLDLRISCFGPNMGDISANATFFLLFPGMTFTEEVLHLDFMDVGEL